MKQEIQKKSILERYLELSNELSNVARFFFKVSWTDETFPICKVKSSYCTYHQNKTVAKAPLQSLGQIFMKVPFHF